MAGAVSLVVPAGRVASQLVDFVTMVDLAGMPAEWWNDTTPDLGNVRVLRDGSPVPFDVAAYDRAARTGDLFFKATLEPAVDNTFTIAIVDGAEPMDPASPNGRYAVWSDYAAFLHGFTDRSGKTAGAVAGGGVLPPPITPGWVYNQNSAYVMVAGVPQLTEWTQAVTFRPRGSLRQAGLVSYSHAGSSESLRETIVLDDGDRLGLYNTTNGWTYFSSAPEVALDTRYRAVETYAGTAGRRAYLNGVPGGSRATTAVRPGAAGAEGHALFLTCRSTSASERWNGEVNYAYLRQGVLSPEWIAAEYASWESPSTFYALTAGEFIPSVTGRLSGSGELSAQTEVTRIAIGHLAGSGALSATVTIPDAGEAQVVEVTGNLRGAGTLRGWASSGVGQLVDVTGTLSGTGTLSAAEGSGRVIVMQMALGILDEEIDQAPTSIVVVGYEGWPDAVVEFRVDGEPVYQTVLDSEGDLPPTSIPIPDTVTAGEHMLEIAPITNSGVTEGATASFTVLRNPAPLPEIPATDVDPVEIAEALQPNGLRRWVLQDLTPGGLGSWVFPRNPEGADPWPFGRTLANEKTIGLNGRYQITEGVGQVQEWSFSGRYETREFQDRLDAYASLGRRLYLIDHRNRAWTISILGIDLTPALRKRDVVTGLENDETGQYSVDVLIYGSWKDPQ